MKIKQFLLFSLLFLLICGSFYVFLSKAKFTEAQSRSSSVRISSVGGYSSQALITLTPGEEPSIYVNYYEQGEQNIDSLKIDFYKAEKKDLLKFLTYSIVDDNRIQYGSIDVSNLSYLTTIYKDSYEKDAVLLPVINDGIYFARVTVNENEFNDVMFLKTNVATVIKENGNDGYLFWAQDIVSGLQVDSAFVELYKLNNYSNKVREASIGTEGFVDINNIDDSDIAIITTNKEQMAVVPIRYPEYGYYYNYGDNYNIDRKIYLFTDRPVYKPGDKLYFKSIVRKDDDGVYSLPEDSLRVTIHEPGNNEPIYQKDLKIDSNGNISDEFLLGESAKTGTYYIRARKISDNEFDSNSFTYLFNVEEYRKPEYVFNTSVSKLDFTKGDEVDLKISGNYFFGAPLSDKEVEVKVISSNFYGPKQITKEELEKRASYGFWYGEEVDSTQIKLDKNGYGNFIFDTSKIDFRKQEYFYGEPVKIVVLEVSYNDESGNRARSFSNVLVFESDITVENNSKKYSAPINSNLPLNFKFENKNNNTAFSNAQVSVDLKRIYWDKKLNDNKVNKWSNEYIYEQKEDLLESFFVETNLNGEISFPLYPELPGSYEIILSFKDLRGNEIKRKYSVWVYDPSQYTYYSANSESEYSIDVEPEYSEERYYNPGDQINLKIQTSEKNRDVLLTIERGKVRRHKVVHLNDYVNNINIDTLETDLPNIFIKVSGFSTNGFGSGHTNIILNNDSKKVKIDVQTEKTEFSPGETIDLKLKTTDVNNNPVSANVSLWAVDKAIYEVISDNRENIFEFFWSERWNSVMTIHSLKDISNPGGAEKGGGGGDLASATRTDFEDVAYWNPSIQTNSFGEAEISFVLPDNLTTWVINSVGATSDTKVGESQKEIIVTKPLIVRPIIPNYFRSGDEVNLATLIYNYTESDQSVSASCKMSFSEDVEEKKYDIKSNQFVQLLRNFEITEGLGSDNKLTCSAYSLENKEISDSVQYDLPIKDFGFYNDSVQVSNSNVDYKVSFDEFTKKDKSKVLLTLSSSIYGTLPESMKYLIDYPYGCMEQTTSRFVHAVIVKENYSLFENYLADKDLDEIINEGIDSLEDKFQFNGGWSWWSFGDLDPFLTAYAVEYLKRAKDLGYAVDENMLNSVEGYAKRLYESPSIQDNVAGAYILNNLNKKQNYSITNESELDILSIDALSMAIIVNYNNNITNPNENGVSLLLSKAQKSSSYMWWEDEKNSYFGYGEAASAMALKALVTVGDKENADKVVRFLSNSKKKSYWSNTYSTAQTIESLTKYSNLYNDNGFTDNYQIIIDGEEYLDGTFENSFDFEEIEIPIDKLKNGSVISVKSKDNKLLFSNLLVREFVDDKNVGQVDDGLKVTRSYRGNFVPGETITVEIVVDNVPVGLNNQLVVEDFLPAGLVPVNINLDNEKFINNDWTNLSEYKTKDDGVIFGYYYGYDQPNKVVSTYQARVVSRGTFSAPPAVASLMYMPEIKGHSGVHVVKVSDNARDSGVVVEPSPLLTHNKILIMLLIIIMILSGTYLWKVKKKNQVNEI